MSVRNMFVLAWNLVRSASRPVQAAVFAGPPVLILLIWLTTPDKVPVAAAGLAALVVIFTALVGKLIEGLLTARLEPASGYGPEVDPAAVGELARELDSLGFKPAGLFILRQGQLTAMLEARANEALRAYATIHCGDRTVRPTLKLESFYEGERVFMVDNSRLNVSRLYPDSVVNDHYPGRRPAELLDAFLRTRPDRGLLETPPEKFERFYKLINALLRAHLLKAKRRK